MTVVVVEATIFVSRPLARVFLQLARECQGSFILDLHQDLINWGVQWGEACEPFGGRLRAPIILSISSLAIFHPLSCLDSSCLSFFLGFSSRASSASSVFMYLVAL